MTDHKEDACRIGLRKQCVNKGPVFIAQLCAPAAAVETAAGDHEGEHALGQGSQLSGQAFLRAQPVAGLPERTRQWLRRLQQLCIIQFNIPAGACGAEGL